MKVSDAGSTPPPSNRTDTGSAQQSKSFDQVLGRKNDERQSKKSHGRKAAGAEESDGRNALAAGLGQPDALPLQSLDSAKSAAPAAAPDFRALEGLVSEIRVVAGSDPRVEMQFQSKTLDGLNVRISKNGDQVSIRFLTGSDSVAQLLTKNTDQLTQSLQAKGVPIGNIRVELAPSAPQSADSGRSSRDGQRGERDPRQDRRQR